ncbi:MAG: hypothetical protein E5Y04_31710 [Mesorhizobium sp.]|nr:MAG: hypothetical protein E5Y04_31710 [Mesorhizobium sp.]
MRFAAIYGTGAAIGFSPRQIDEMTVWQFMASVNGYIKANSSDDQPLSGSERDELWELVKAKSH